MSARPTPGGPFTPAPAALPTATSPTSAQRAQPGWGTRVPPLQPVFVMKMDRAGMCSLSHLTHTQPRLAKTCPPPDWCGKTETGLDQEEVEVL